MDRKTIFNQYGYRCFYIQVMFQKIKNRNETKNVYLGEIDFDV